MLWMLWYSKISELFSELWGFLELFSEGGMPAPGGIGFVPRRYESLKIWMVKHSTNRGI